MFPPRVVLRMHLQYVYVPGTYLSIHARAKNDSFDALKTAGFLYSGLSRGIFVFFLQKLLLLTCDGLRSFYAGI